MYCIVHYTYVHSSKLVCMYHVQYDMYVQEVQLHRLAFYVHMYAQCKVCPYIYSVITCITYVGHKNIVCIMIMHAYINVHAR
jgi:hypothetical protein